MRTPHEIALFFDGSLQSEKDELFSRVAREGVLLLDADGPTRRLIVRDLECATQVSLMRSSALVAYWVDELPAQIPGVRLELAFLESCDVIVFVDDQLTPARGQRSRDRFETLVAQIELVGRAFPPALVVVTRPEAPLTAIAQTECFDSTKIIVLTEDEPPLRQILRTLATDGAAR